MTDATGTAPPGLRERKRLATRRAIQLATLGLLAEHGLDGVTVDEISRRADISPRTFFNYFGSKEEVIIGDQPVLPDAAELEAFVLGDGPLLEDLASLLGSAAERSMADAEVVRLRMGVLKEHPQLLALRMTTMRRFEDEVAGVVEQRLARQGPGEDPEVIASRARLVTLVAFGAMRHAWTRWARAEPPSRLEQELTTAFQELKSLLASGVGDIR